MTAATVPYTTGDWWADKRGRHVMADGPNGLVKVADVTALEGPAVTGQQRVRAAQRRANARLMASAPQMFQWLKQHVRNADCTCHDLGGDGLSCDVCEAKAIIAAVEGDR